MDCDKLKSFLCMIKTIMHIIVFFALALVLFDVHGMLKAQKEYMQAMATQSTAQLNTTGNH